MTNCEKCGAELKEDSAFCQQCGTSVSLVPVAAATPAASVPPTDQRVIDLAGWGDRIIAYIIDAIIFGVIFGIIGTIIALPTITWYRGIPNMQYMPFFSSGFRDVAFFIYFFWMDLSYGQSIGKMIMKLRVTTLDGGPINASQAAIESLGKAFGQILFLDVILGWIFTNHKSQRIFSYLARTIVVKDRTLR